MSETSCSWPSTERLFSAQSYNLFQGKSPLQYTGLRICVEGGQVRIEFFQFLDLYRVFRMPSFGIFLGTQDKFVKPLDVFAVGNGQRTYASKSLFPGADPVVEQDRVIDKKWCEAKTG